MKVELKHLAPYLPYNIDIACPEGVGKMLSLNKEIGDLTIKNDNGIDVSADFGENFEWSFGSVRPILRPLTDIYNEEYKKLLISCETEHDVFNFIHQPLKQSYEDVQVLLQNHFDVFGLIEKGLAIDINTTNH